MMEMLDDEIGNGYVSYRLAAASVTAIIVTIVGGELTVAC